MGVFKDLRTSIYNLSQNITNQKTELTGIESSFPELSSWFDRDKLVSVSLDSFHQKIKSGRVSYDHFEKHMMPKSPNRYPSSHRFGFDSSLGQFSNLFEKIEDVSEKKNINSIRYRVHLLMNEIKAFAETNSSIDFINSNYPEYGVKDLLRFKFEWQTLIGERDSSLRDQLIETLSKLNMLISSYRDLQSQIQNANDSKLIDADVISINIFKIEIDSILLSSSEETETIVEDIATLVDYQEIDSIQRSRTKNISNAIKNPLFKHVRSDYLRAQTSSVSEVATSVNGGQESPHAGFDEVTQSFTPNAEMTPVSLDQGDEIQANPEIISPDYTDAVGPLSEDDMKVFLNWLGNEESGNNYTSVNRYGFSGRFQHGGPSLEDLGFVKSGTSTRGTSRASAWLGKKGINSRENWLGNSGVQDETIIVWMKMLYRRILNVGAITVESSKADVAGYLAVAHLLGSGGARDLKNGTIGSDANGTTARDYYNGASGSVGGSVEVANAEHAAANRDASMLNTIPSGSPIIVPSSPAAPVYPYNQARTFEAGHVEEYDSTPGSERVLVKHATGTGYEIGPDGNRVETVNRDNYKVVLGDDYVIVNGFVNIFVEGDAGITANSVNLRAENDMNLMIGGDWNVNVGGSQNIVVNGQSQTLVQGDAAETVGGFKTVGIGGDHQVEADSMTLMAKAGNMNILSQANASLIGHEKVAIISSDTTTLVSEGNTSITSSGNITTTAAGDNTVYAEGKTVTHGDGGNLVSSNAQTGIAGAGTIALSHPVEKALYSDTAGTAPLGPAIPFPLTAAANDNGGSGIHGGAADKSEPDEVEKIIDEFEPSEFEESQANQHGPIATYEPSRNQPIET